MQRGCEHALPRNGMFDFGKHQIVLAAAADAAEVSLPTRLAEPAARLAWGLPRLTANEKYAAFWEERLDFANNYHFAAAKRAGKGIAVASSGERLARHRREGPVSVQTEHVADLVIELLTQEAAVPPPQPARQNP